MRDTSTTIVLAGSARTSIEAGMGEEQRPVLNIEIGDVHVMLLSPVDDPDGMVRLALELCRAAQVFHFMAQQQRRIFSPPAA
jgi:hypothetical protein